MGFIKGTAGTILFIGYMLLGLVQLGAAWAGFEVWFGPGWGFVAFILACIVAYIPIVGMVAGYVGATEAWGWSGWEAGALFFGVPVAFITFFVVAGLVSAAAEGVKSARRKREGS